MKKIISTIVVCLVLLGLFIGTGLLKNISGSVIDDTDNMVVNVICKLYR